MGVELVWPSLCLLAALFLFIAEIFVPSGGLIGLLAVGLLIVSQYLAFTTTAHGWVFLAVTVLLLPPTFMLAVHLWPKTPLAKYIFLQPTHSEEQMPAETGSGLRHLIGQFGKTLTPLRPTGVVLFEGRRHEGISEGAHVPENTLVRAIEIRGGRLIVRAADLPGLGDGALS